MKWTDLKYLTAYIIPLLTYVAVKMGGWMSFAPFIFAFVIVPLLEPLLSSSTNNYSDVEKEDRLSTTFFDILLLINIPIVYGLLFLFIHQYSIANFTTIEIIGLTLSYGTLLGACGINVAHELGHRKLKFYHFCAKLLLLPNHYLHFFIEHNRGHHKNIATDEDPASAKLNESLYKFWVRSSIFSYLHAWKLEYKRLNQKWFSLQNEMIQYTLVSILYISFLWIYLPNRLAIVIILMGVVGFLLLETINYIEHYGLRRKIMPNGRYERVKPIHSWNSNHYLGRIMLYELTRHSDHHYLANKEYQILEHHENSPQLPLGYPTSMLLALLPPLWFKVINPRIPIQ